MPLGAPYPLCMPGSSVRDVSLCVSGGMVQWPGNPRASYIHTTDPVNSSQYYEDLAEGLADEFDGAMHTFGGSSITR